MLRLPSGFKVLTVQQYLTDGTKSVILLGKYWKAHQQLCYCGLSSAKLNKEEVIQM